MIEPFVKGVLGIRAKLFACVCMYVYVHVCSCMHACV